LFLKVLKSKYGIFVQSNNFLEMSPPNPLCEASGKQMIE
jgi:hypothetical protein